MVRGTRQYVSRDGSNIPFEIIFRIEGDEFILEDVLCPIKEMAKNIPSEDIYYLVEDTKLLLSTWENGITGPQGENDGNPYDSYLTEKGIYLFD